MAKYILTFMYMYVHMYNLKSFSRLWNNNSPEDNVLALWPIQAGFQTLTRLIIYIHLMSSL